MKFNRVQYFYATTVINSLCYNITEIFCSFAFPRSMIILTFHNKKKCTTFKRSTDSISISEIMTARLKRRTFLIRPNEAPRRACCLLSTREKHELKIASEALKKKRRPVAILIHVSSSVIDVFNRFGRLDEVSVIFIHGSR